MLIWIMQIKHNIIITWYCRLKFYFISCKRNLGTPGLNLFFGDIVGWYKGWHVSMRKIVTVYKKVHERNFLCLTRPSKLCFSQ